MKRALTVFLILVLLGVIVAGGSFLFSRDRSEQLYQVIIDRIDAPASADSNPVEFTVEPGEGAATIADKLKKAGLINSPTFFRLLVSYYGVGSQLKAGDYELRPNMTVSEIIGVLRHGLVKKVRITVPEGWRAEEIADALAQRGIFAREEFLAAVKGAVLPFDFLGDRPAEATLEGYLFPDTYDISPRSSAADFVREMVENFGRRVTPSMREQARSRELTLFQVVTLASIVEREAAVPAERPIIASVFLNRLAKGMPLAADPTVQYAVGSDPESVARYGYWKKEGLYLDLKVDSPYNTYVNGGLPPGPICNPGLAAIEAVLEPAQTDYLFFVAQGDGSHLFAATLEEHLTNIEKVAK